MTAPVVDRLGVRVHRHDGLAPEVLLGLALRRNPRRAQLLVSRVLGKHVPTDPRLVRAAALLLGRGVADVLAGRPRRPLPADLFTAAVEGCVESTAALHVTASAPEPGHDALVLGYAETATALGHGVAEALTCDYLHSTRRVVPGFTAAGGFREEHSHATEHLLLPAGPALLRGGRPLVLVDDELSTGRTVLNTITELHALAPREHYVVAALVDLRGDHALEEAVAALGARLDVVALGRAGVELPADVAARADAIRAGLPDAPPVPTPVTSPVDRIVLADLGWPAGLPTGGRHGFRASDHAVLDAALPATAAALAARARLEPGQRVLVLGTEELMALPLRLAQTLADAVATPRRSAQDAPAEPSGNALQAATEPWRYATAEGAGPGRSAPEAAAEPRRSAQHSLAAPGQNDHRQGLHVAFSTTSRSPAVVVDEPGYALRSGITFPAHDDPADGPGPRYAYNLGHTAPWDHVLVIVDPPADTPALHTGLLAALRPCARRTTVVVTP